MLWQIAGYKRRTGRRVERGLRIRPDGRRCGRVAGALRQEGPDGRRWLRPALCYGAADQGDHVSRGLRTVVGSRAGQRDGGVGVGGQRHEMGGREGGEQLCIPLLSAVPQVRTSQWSDGDGNRRPSAGEDFVQGLKDSPDAVFARGDWHGRYGRARGVSGPKGTSNRP